jgi:hypothetical protein
MIRSIALLMIVLCVAAAPADAGIPKTISFQGILGDSMGTPKPDGFHTFTFRLYEVSGGGSAKWTETKALQTVSGRFSTLLGDVAPLPDSLAFDQQYYLGITLSTDAGEMAPRIALSSVPYSLTAARAETASVGESGGWTSGGNTLTYVNGNVGIGTPSPGSRLEVHDSTPFAVVTIRNNNPDGTGLKLVGSGSGVPLVAESPFGGSAAVVGEATGFLGFPSGIGVRGVSGNNYGVAGISDTIGTYGEAVSLTSTNYGVIGKGNGPLGTGVFGFNASTGSGFTVGVYGRAPGTNGSGVYGEAGGNGGTFAGGRTGVYAFTTSQDLNASGIIGEATAPSGQTVGVYGKSIASAVGTGVVGVGSATGGYFEATAPNGNAAVFTGNVTLNGNLSVSGTITGPTAWTSLPLSAGYETISTGSAQYRKIGDLVYLRGYVLRTGGGNIPLGAVIATLPVAYRPPPDRGYQNHHQSRNHNLSVAGDGQVIVVNQCLNCGGPDIWLDGISFSTTP